MLTHHIAYKALDDFDAYEYEYDLDQEQSERCMKSFRNCDRMANSIYEHALIFLIIMKHLEDLSEVLKINDINRTATSYRANLLTLPIYTSSDDEERDVMLGLLLHGFFDSVQAEQTHKILESELAPKEYSTVSTLMG